ncbi:hypothetical protein AB3A98_003055 [Vibrio parahaemolyticus]
MENIQQIHPENIVLFELIQSGTKPVVRINETIFVDSFLEPGMKARVIGCQHDHLDSWEFVLDFSEFYEENKQYMTEYSDGLNAEESGRVPKRMKESVYCSISFHPLAFDALDEARLGLYLKYQSEVPEKERATNSYMHWLESKVLEK